MQGYWMGSGAVLILKGIHECVCALVSVGHGVVWVLERHSILTRQSQGKGLVCLYFYFM